MKKLRSYLRPALGGNAENGVIFATLPKSGTDFIDNSMMRIAGLSVPDIYNDPEVIGRIRTGYYPFDTPHIGVGNFDTQFLNAKTLGRYLAAGHLVSTHAIGSFYNLKAMEAAGVRRLTVLMRDPRDSTISLRHHIARGGPQQRNNLMQFLYLPADYFDWTETQQSGFLARTYLPKAISWIESWFGALAEQPTDLSMEIMYHDHLRQDARGFVDRIVAHHRIANPDMSALPAKEELAHFRRGASREYLEVFGPEELELARLLMSERLPVAYGRAARAVVERIDAASADEKAPAILALARTLPNSTVTANYVCDWLRSAGAGNIDGLQAEWSDWVGEADREPLDYPAHILAKLPDLFEAA